MNEILTAKRKVTSGWHHQQATALKKIAVEKTSATALVYAALELRIGLERYIFEMSIAAIGGQLTSENLRTARKKKGVFNLLQESMENYRRNIEFMNMVIDQMKIPYTVPIPDLRTIRQLIDELSDYCHPQFDPLQTVNHPTGSWFIEGITLIDKAIELLGELVKQPRGAMTRESMPPEVCDLFDEYLQGSVDETTVRTRLNLMEPVLRSRANLRK